MEGERNVHQIIAYPGTAGSFSCAAAQEAFPEAHCEGYPTFPEAAQAVVEGKADYELVMSSDDVCYGGQGLVEHMTYHSKAFNGQHFVELYLPARTALVFRKAASEKA